MEKVSNDWNLWPIFPVPVPRTEWLGLPYCWFCNCNQFKFYEKASSSPYDTSFNETRDRLINLPNWLISLALLGAPKNGRKTDPFTLNSCPDLIYSYYILQILVRDEVTHSLRMELGSRRAGSIKQLGKEIKDILTLYSLRSSYLRHPLLEEDSLLSIISVSKVKSSCMKERSLPLFGGKSLCEVLTWIRLKQYVSRKRGQGMNFSLGSLFIDKDGSVKLELNS